MTTTNETTRKFAGRPALTKRQLLSKIIDLRALAQREARTAATLKRSVTARPTDLRDEWYWRGYTEALDEVLIWFRREPESEPEAGDV